MLSMIDTPLRNARRNLPVVNRANTGKLVFVKITHGPNAGKTVKRYRPGSISSITPLRVKEVESNSRAKGNSLSKFARTIGRIGYHKWS